MSLKEFFNSLDDETKLENIKTNLINKLNHLYDIASNKDKDYINQSIQLIKSLNINNFNFNKSKLIATMRSCNKIYKKFGD
jgi:hypothetical protein